MEQMQQRTILVTRIMGKVGESTREVITLVSTDRIISANRDGNEDFTWLRYETARSGSGQWGEYQNWKVKETPVELHALTNRVAECN